MAMDMGQQGQRPHKLVLPCHGVPAVWNHYCMIFGRAALRESPHDIVVRHFNEEPHGLELPCHGLSSDHHNSSSG